MAGAVWAASGGGATSAGGAASAYVGTSFFLFRLVEVHDKKRKKRSARQPCAVWQHISTEKKRDGFGFPVIGTDPYEHLC